MPMNFKKGAGVVQVLLLKPVNGIGGAVDQLKKILALYLGLLSACAHAAPETIESLDSPFVENAPVEPRLAKAQLVTKNGLPLRGAFHFEQMPNSTLVTYSLAGLRPLVIYQIFVSLNSDCRHWDLSSAVPLSRFRANKTGISENTFKTEKFTVSRENPLLGESILVVGQPQPKEALAPQVACGPVLTSKGI